MITNKQLGKYFFCSRTTLGCCFINHSTILTKHDEGGVKPKPIHYVTSVRLYNISCHHMPTILMSLYTISSQELSNLQQTKSIKMLVDHNFE